MMKTFTFSTVTETLNQLEQLLRTGLREIKQWLPTATWVEILLVCIPLALVITLFPLVLMLFVLGLLARCALVSDLKSAEAAVKDRPIPTGTTDLAPPETGNHL